MSLVILRRWSICRGLPATVVDLPRIAPDGGRSADIVSACRGGTTAIVWPTATTVAAAPPRPGPSRQRNGGGSTTVYAITHTVVDARHATPTQCRHSGHRLGRYGADRPPSRPGRSRSSTVSTPATLGSAHA